jgi:hypothetical protein
VIEARLTDGGTRSQRIESVRGGPGRPIPEAEVLEKFRVNAQRAIKPSDVEALCGAILSVDTEPTLAPLTKALRQPKS